MNRWRMAFVTKHSERVSFVLGVTVILFFLLSSVFSSERREQAGNLFLLFIKQITGSERCLAS